MRAHRESTHIVMVILDNEVDSGQREREREMERDGERWREREREKERDKEIGGD